MSDVQLSSKTFFKRAAKIFDAWDQPEEDWAEAKDAEALLILMGDADEDVSFTKSSSIQQYLLGYEFPSTIIIFHKSPRRVTFVGSASKAKILNQLKTTDGIEIEMQVRGKDEASAIIPDVVSSLAGKTVGYLPKDQAKGKIADEWKNAVERASPAVKYVDAAGAISCVLGAKDQDEIKSIHTSARMSSTVMANYFKMKMESVIDRGTKMSCSDLAVLVEEKIGTEDKEPDMKLWKKNPQLGDVDWSSVEWGLNPIVQANGKFDVRLNATSSETDLKPGVISCSLGVRYKTYSSLMTRTFMIDPNPQQEKYYSILLDARKEAFALLKPGAVARDVYTAVQELVGKKSGTLRSTFSKTIGFQTGIEFRDSNFVLGPKNSREVQEGMVLVVSLSVTDLPDPKKSSQNIADTVKVGKEGAISLTEGVFKLNDIVTNLEGDDEEEEEDVKPQIKEKKDKKPAPSSKSNGKDKPRPVVPTGGARTTRGQRQQGAPEQTTAEKIKDNQDRLHEQRQKEGLKRFTKGGKGKNGQEEKQVKKYESYRREEQLPRLVEERRVLVDEQRSTVVLPIYGYAVPFHISTIKNVTKTEEAEHFVLRINFQSPGQIAGKKEDMPFEDPDATFVRSASFRSKDLRHMTKVYESITALKKAATKREAERKEMADVIEQEKLVEVKGRHPYVLKGVYPRPALDGKKTDGNLEIHQNGVRFRPDGPQNKIDVLFSNVKHLFFQPSEKELIVLIHFHLRSPIMIGKKKTYDVQFYRDVTDGFDETGGKKRRARYGDEDEIEQEQEERRRRAEHDKVFQDFARRIEQAAQHQQHELEVDMPFRELGFGGVPFRSNVMLLPTANCLIHVSELPFTVITLNEIEIVHLERVQFGLKNFDMVFVLQDFKKTPVHINNIPVVHLDNVKEWLDSCDVPLSEGPVNLSWPQIMKTVNEDPYAFFEEGGWGFLTGGDGGDSESESEEGSEFEADSEVFASEGSSDEDSESDFGDSDDSDGSDFDDDEESGEDWDELERKAKKSDEKRKEKNGDSSDDERGKKKKGGRR